MKRYFDCLGCGSIVEYDGIIVPPCPACGSIQWQERAKPPKADEFEFEECVICGCTDDHACEGGCHWVAPGLCSACAEKMEGVFKHIITSVGKDPRGTPFADNVHHTAEEMEYLVRYQVQDWPYERVAAEYGVDIERVKQVCKEISSILGMQLRGES